MTPLTTRARELAARERKLYDQTTIPAVLEELADEVERLTNLDAEYNLRRTLQIEQQENTELAATVAELRAEAANIAAQRDEAVLRAEAAEERLAAMQRSRDRYREAWESEKRRFSEASAKWHGDSAELARIRAADRTSITVRTTEAAKMRKGQAI